MTGFVIGQQSMRNSVHHTEPGGKDSLYSCPNKRALNPSKASSHRPAWKTSSEWEQILVVQKISLCCSARGSEDKQNQQAAFDGRKASLNRAWQNTSSAAADSCRRLCQYEKDTEWNWLCQTKLVSKHQHWFFTIGTGAALCGGRGAVVFVVWRSITWIRFASVYLGPSSPSPLKQNNLLLGLGEQQVPIAHRFVCGPLSYILCKSGL